jgi:hypothetical protein
MEAIITFLSAFFGSFSAFFLFHYFTRQQTTNNSSLRKQSIPRALHAVKNKLNPPKGMVLHSPTVEEEEKEMEREAIEKFEKLREKISLDLRK